MRYKPMLAYPVSSKPIDYNDKVFIQPKLDGVRCLIQYDEKREFEGNGVVAYSRTGKEWKNIDHILEQLRPFFMKWPNIVLDGELYNHLLRDDFEQIISLVRRQKPDDVDMLESAEMVQFHCYDIIDTKISFKTRDEFIKDYVPKSYCVKHVLTMPVPNPGALHYVHGSNIESGYEGSIVRLNTVYECKRSHSLRKFKEFHDAEAQIVGYEPGKGKREGTLGKFYMIDPFGVKFGCPPGKGYTYKDMADILDNIGDYIGKNATFTYFERTKAGSYRHPQFKCIRDYE